MHPILYDFGFFPLRTYGVMLALGFLAAFIFARLQAKRAGIDPNIIPDLLIWIFAGGIIGARLLYVAIHYKEFDNPIEIFAIWKGGQVYYGGFIGAVIAGYIFAKRRKLKVLDLADLAMPAAMLGQAIGRWGCFMAGCCYGKQADPDFPLGVAFPKIDKSLIPPECQNADLAHPTCFLHPTQLYMSANALILWLVLWFLLRRRKHRGVVTGAALVLYAVTRSVLELWRGDMDERGLTHGLSTSQWVSIPILLLGVYFIVAGRKRPVPRKAEGEQAGTK
jgi:phosphatidylglycerol:prolipoprotein diacylglycerol transferase